MSTVELQTKKSLIFFSTLHKVHKDEVAGTGDIDYTLSIEASMNRIYRESCCYIREKKTEQEIFEFIEQHRANDAPILHIMVNAPNIGLGYTEQGLKDFKSKNGRLVITAVEFRKYSSPEQKKEVLDRLQYADEIIFLDEFDKQDALFNVVTHFPTSADFLAKIGNAIILPVPATVAPNLLPITKRGHNIASFGILRAGKGLDHVLRLAKLLKKTSPGNKLLEETKILIIGTVLEPEKLAQLMKEVYPEQTKAITDCGDKVDKLKALLNDFKKLELEGKIKPNLPIELHVDVPEPELAPLFNRCIYFFQPNYRGASFRFSSISSLLSLGCNIFSHSSDITAKELELGGFYQNAMKLFPESLYISDQDDYAKGVLEDILIREQDWNTIKTKPASPENKEKSEQKIADELSLIEETSYEAQNLYNIELRPKIIQQKLTQLYEKLGQVLKPDPETESRQKARAKSFWDWSDSIARKRAFDLVQSKVKIDIETHAINRLKALKIRLQEVEPLNICPKVKELLQEQRKPREINGKQLIPMLTPLEAYFVRLMLDSDWEARHVTTKNTLQNILKTGKGLLSIEQRRKSTRQVTAHTPDYQGMTDHVFASWGVGKNIHSPHFISNFQGVVVFDLNAIQRDNPESLRDVWASDHWPSYKYTGTRAEYKIFDVVFRVEHRAAAAKTADASETVKPVADDKTAETQIHQKYLTYTLPGNKTTYTQVVELGDELFMHPNINLAMALLTVEMMRYLGIDAYQKIMAIIKTIKENPLNCDFEMGQLRKLMRTRFHPGLWEVHKPRRWLVNNQPGVTAVTRSVNQMTEAQIDEWTKVQGIDKEIILLAEFQGKILVKEYAKVSDVMRDAILLLLTEESLDLEAMKKLMLCLQNHGLLCSNFEFGETSMALISATLLGGRRDLFEYIMSFDLEDSAFQQLSIDPGRYWNTVDLVTLLSNPEKLDEFIYSKLKLPKKPLKIDAKTAFEMFHLVIHGALPGKTNFIYPYINVLPEHIAAACCKIKASPAIIRSLLMNYYDNPAKLSILWGVLSGSVDVLQEFIELGLDPTQPHVAKVSLLSDSHSEIPEGFTALHTACHFGDDSYADIVEVLLKKNKELKPWYMKAESIDLKEAQNKKKATEPEAERRNLEFALINGYSPLMLAGRKGSKKIMSILLHAKDKIDHISVSNDTIFTLNCDIAEVIESFMRGTKLEHELNVLANFLEPKAQSTSGIIEAFIRYLLTKEIDSIDSATSISATPIKAFLDFLHQHQLLNFTVQLGSLTISTLNAALLAPSLTVFEYILKLGPSINSIKFFSLDKSEVKDPEWNSLLSTALKRTNPSELKSLYEDRLGLPYPALVPRNSQIPHCVLEYLFEDKTLSATMPRLTARDIGFAFHIYKNENSEFLDKLIRNYAKVPGSIKQLSLCWPIYYRNTAALKTMLELGVEIEQAFLPQHDIRHGSNHSYHIPHGLLPLQQAILADNPEMVSLLLDKNARLDLVRLVGEIQESHDFDGFSPLMLAAKRRSSLIIGQLLRANADINYEDPFTGMDFFSVLGTEMGADKITETVIENALQDTEQSIKAIFSQDKKSMADILRGSIQYLLTSSHCDMAMLTSFLDSLHKQKLLHYRVQVGTHCLSMIHAALLCADPNPLNYLLKIGNQLDQNELIELYIKANCKEKKESFILDKFIDETPASPRMLTAVSFGLSTILNYRGPFSINSLKKLIDYLLTADHYEWEPLKTLLDFVRKQHLLNYKVKFGDITISVADAALLGYSLEPFNYLRPTFNDWNSMLSLAIARLDPTSLDGIFFDMKLPKQAHKSRSVEESASLIHHLLDQRQLVLKSPGQTRPEFCINAADIGTACLVFKKQPEIILKLISHYGTKPEDWQRLSLCWAIYTENPEILQALLDKGVDLEAPYQYHKRLSQNFDVPPGITALQLACFLSNNNEACYASMVRQLLERGAAIKPVHVTDYDASKINELSPLMLAAQNKAKSILSILLKANADIHYKTSSRKHLFHILEHDEKVLDDIMKDQNQEAEFISLVKFISPDMQASSNALKSLILYLMTKEQYDNESLKPLLQYFKKQDYLLNFKFRFGALKLSVMNALALGTHLEPFEFLLTLQPEIESEKFLDTASIGNDWHSLLAIIMARSNPKTLRSQVFDKLDIPAASLWDRDPKSASSALEILHKNYKLQVEARDIWSACTVFKSEPSLILRLLTLYGSASHKVKQLSLCWGVYTRNLEITKAMIKMGVDINQVIDERDFQAISGIPLNFNALHTICYLGDDSDIALVECLLKHKIDLNTQLTHFMPVSLMFDPLIVPETSEAADLLNYIMDDNCSPLMIAIKKGQKKITERLLMAGAQVHFKTKLNKTAVLLQEEIYTNTKEPIPLPSLSEHKNAAELAQSSKHYNKSYILIKGRTPTHEDFIITVALMQTKNTCHSSFLEYNSDKYRREDAIREFNFRWLLGIDLSNLKWHELGTLTTSESIGASVFHLCDIGAISKRCFLTLESHEPRLAMVRNSPELHFSDRSSMKLYSMIFSLKEDLSYTSPPIELQPVLNKCYDEENAVKIFHLNLIKLVRFGDIKKLNSYLQSSLSLDFIQNPSSGQGSKSLSDFIYESAIRIALDLDRGDIALTLFEKLPAKSQDAFLVPEKLWKQIIEFDAEEIFRRFITHNHKQKFKAEDYSNYLDFALLNHAKKIVHFLLTSDQTPVPIASLEIMVKKGDLDWITKLFSLRPDLIFNNFAKILSFSEKHRKSEITRFLKSFDSPKYASQQRASMISKIHSPEFGEDIEQLALHENALGSASGIHTSDLTLESNPVFDQFESFMPVSDLAEEGNGIEDLGIVFEADPLKSGQDDPFGSISLTQFGGGPTNASDDRTIAEDMPLGIQTQAVLQRPIATALAPLAYLPFNALKAPDSTPTPSFENPEKSQNPDTASLGLTDFYLGHGSGFDPLPAIGARANAEGDFDTAQSIKAKKFF